MKPHIAIDGKVLCGAELVKPVVVTPSESDYLPGEKYRTTGRECGKCIKAIPESKSGLQYVSIVVEGEVPTLD